MLKGNEQRQAHFQLEPLTLPRPLPMHTYKHLRSEESPSNLPNSSLCLI